MWGNSSRPVNGGNVLGDVAYKNKIIYCFKGSKDMHNKRQRVILSFRRRIARCRKVLASPPLRKKG